MQSLGSTRSAHRANHLLHTPDTFVRAAWAGIEKATAIIHASPAIGAKFTQFTVELEPGGRVPSTPHQRFVYVLTGSLNVGAAELAPGGYAYIPAGSDSTITATQAATATVIDKPYIPAGSSRPPAFAGIESHITSQPLGGDPALQVRSLIPASPAFDFAVNTMTFLPGAALSMVEVHVMEHGLLFLEGGGIYRLGDNWYPVTKGDFIYMAPYCPQWFGALGKTPAKYLIYKDWNRSAQ
jgi:(S)-ureidoglycine aminohydrolase